MPAGDSIEAIKAVWMEGYREGYRQGLSAPKPPVVEISMADIKRVYEPGSCDQPSCPACQEASR